MQPFVTPPTPSATLLPTPTIHANVKTKTDFWQHQGNKIQLDKSKTTATKSSPYGFNTVFGSIPINEGKHIWKIKVIQLTEKMVIGLSTSLVNIDTKFHNQPEYPHYAYHSNALKISQKKQYSTYGTLIQSGDIITVILDLNHRYVAFMNNGKDLGVAFKNIDIGYNIKYRIAVSILDKSDCVKIIGYGQYHSIEHEDDAAVDNAEIKEVEDAPSPPPTFDLNDLKSWNNRKVNQFVRKTLKTGLNALDGSDLDELCNAIKANDHNGNEHRRKQPTDIKTFIVVFMISILITYFIVYLYDTLFQTSKD
eukprot:51764_1